MHASSDHFYLDCGGGGWIGGIPGVKPNLFVKWVNALSSLLYRDEVPNGNSWCDPFKTWQKVRGWSDDQRRVTSEEA